MTRVQKEPRFKDGWGETIKEIREYRGYSQYQIAKMLDVSKATVSKWEREMMIPSVESAISIANILKVDVETIFDI